ncbi:hypothetical protein RV07_GL003306 [Enterococcus malodoratus]|nr:hypothetical protein RV07_GL003306 [Enterococcus malodoratus]
MFRTIFKEAEQGEKAIPKNCMQCLVLCGKVEVTKGFIFK